MGNGSGRLEDRYYLQKVKLGQGSFGTVWRAVDRHTSDVVAVKQLDKAAMPKRGVKRQDIEREIHVMQAVGHENITRLLGFFEDHTSIYLALEYCDGGDFGDKVKERGLNLKEAEAAEWMRQILSAIRHLHERSLCHRDIKPDNFMVHMSVLKLSDFGLAVFVERGRLLTEKCGTPAFMAPEQHRLPRHSRGYTQGCDVWAAGVTMYMLMFGGRHPFLTPGNQLDERRLLEGRMDFNLHQGILGFAVSDMRYTEPARQLCRRLVNADPAKRVSAFDACQDVWLQLAESRRQPSAIQRNHTAPLSEIAPTPSPPRVPVVETPTPTTRRTDRRAQTASPMIVGVPGALQPAPRMPSDDSVGTPVPSWWPWGGVENSPPPNAPNGPNAQPSPEVSQEAAELQKRVEADRRRIEELEAQLQMSREQNESLWEASMHNSKVMEQMKEEKKQLTPAPPGAQPQRKGPPPLPGFYDARKGSKPQLDSRRGSKTGQLSPAPANPQVAARPVTPVAIVDPGLPLPSYEAGVRTVLHPGTKCRYNSSSWAGCIPAVVQSYNDVDGTFNLDIRAHAKPENISPAGDVCASEAWPPGTLVFYQSTSMKAWLPAVIKSFNEGSAEMPGTYNLDVREHATVDRMRPRFPLQQISEV